MFFCKLYLSSKYIHSCRAFRTRCCEQTVIAKYFLHWCRRQENVFSPNIQALDQRLTAGAKTIHLFLSTPKKNRIIIPHIALLILFDLSVQHTLFNHIKLIILMRFIPNYIFVINREIPRAWWHNPIIYMYLTLTSRNQACKL